MNKSLYILAGTLVLLLTFAVGSVISSNNGNPAKDWSLNATAIEACSCPMFCQCYFDTQPAAHGHSHGDAEHFCRFNMAWKVNEGHYGDTRLDGALFWIAGDLGHGWADGTLDWAVVHFDPSVTEEQREGIVNALGPLFPGNWSSFAILDDKPVEWQANDKEAVALLDNGSAGEMRLQHPPTAMSGEPMVLSNLQYWGAPRNDGFVMMPNEVQSYHLGEKAFEFSGTNGFMITVDINAGDVSE